MSGAELFGRANEEFVNENYQNALELYSQAIDADDSKDEYYVNRAQVYLKLEKFEEAVTDAEKALKINPKNPKAYLRKGTALFHLQKYLEAKDSFQASHSFDSENKNIETWIRKCEAEINVMEQEPSSSTSELKVGMSGDNTQPLATSAAQTSQSEPMIQDNSTESPPSQPAPPSMPSGPKTRYDWYQTQTHVVISIMLKKVKKEDADINIQEKSVSVTVKLPSGNDYSLELDLAHKVQPEKSTYKVLSTKIEIKLKKDEELRWQHLEDDGQSTASVKQFTPDAPSEDAAKKYPSSSHYTRNWDKLVTEIKQEEKDEKLEGDAAVNQLFQKIFADGTDETKKAMMKSFYESGGTVLSTNWSDVKKEKVEVKPPDGMEYKKWEK